jgi:hypothetical protein
MKEKSPFKKIAELSAQDRTKLKTYWTELWGKEFADALTTDYKPAATKSEK